MCECGRPKHECRNEANRGLYEVADVTCYAQAAIEEHTGQKGFKAEPGQRFYASELDDELITRRTFGWGKGASQVPDADDEQPGDKNHETDRQP